MLALAARERSKSAKVGRGPVVAVDLGCAASLGWALAVGMPSERAADWICSADTTPAGRAVVEAPDAEPASAVAWASRDSVASQAWDRFASVTEALAVPAPLPVTS